MTKQESKWRLVECGEDIRRRVAASGIKSLLLAGVSFLSTLIAGTPVLAQTTNQYPFQNPALALEERFVNLLRFSQNLFGDLNAKTML